MPTPSLIQKKILAYAKINAGFKTKDLKVILKISRQTTAEHLRKLVVLGQLVKTGSTHNAAYWLPGKSIALQPKLFLVKKLQNLQEHEVFEEIQRRLPLKKSLSKNVQSIATYSFSEMLNNAVDHSNSQTAEMEVEVRDGSFYFKIRDFGIGIFENVKKGFSLNDEYEGAEHLLKGKQTTMPTRHSGQGIFFTSRIADLFVLHSHKLRVVVDNLQDEAYFSDVTYLKGTLIEFRIKQRSRKTLHELFSKFSDPEDFEFDKNEFRVRLRAGTELVSRSQARKLIFGLEEYRRIVFDFKDISGIGQAFVDEIFRVYALANPRKIISYINAGPAVDFMIKRALQDIPK